VIPILDKPKSIKLINKLFNDMAIGPKDFRTEANIQILYSGTSLQWHWVNAQTDENDENNHDE
jgi:hypothetical protein